MKVEKPDVIRMYFQKPLDEVTIKGEQLLNGKSAYQVDYCDIGKLPKTFIVELKVKI